MASVVHTSVGSFIPASQRPDGTWRKQRRVKDGYTPQDEVPLYESKGKQWAKMNTCSIPGIPPELVREKEASQDTAQKQEVKKTKKKKAQPVSGAVLEPLPSQLAAQALGSIAAAEKKQKAESKINSPVKIEEKWETVGKSRGGKDAGATKPKKEQSSQNKDSSQGSSKSNKQTVVKPAKEQKQPQQQQPQQSEVIEPVKRLRNLKKKLKEIEALEAKISSKELKNPDKDQLSKVARKEEIESAILSLELDLALGIKSN